MLLVAGTTLMMGACASKGAAPGVTGSTGPTGSNGPTSSSDSGGAAIGSAGDPCILLTAADIRSALGEAVTRVERLPESTDSDGVSQQCILTTDGPPIGGAAGSALGSMLSAFSGQTIDLSNATGGVGVILQKLNTLPDPSQFDPTELPPGGKVLTGVGDVAIVVPTPNGGAGIALKGDRMVIVMDLEGKSVTADQLETLVRAAVGRL